MRDFFAGAADAFRSIAWWRRTPGALALGLVPAAIVSTIGITLFVTVIFLVLPSQMETLTAWADGWGPVWTGVLQGAIYVAVAGGLIFLLSVTFVALTLAVGDPFYERIWSTVERRLHGAAPDGDSGFWAAIGDASLLFLRGIVGAALAAVLGLIPVVGPVVGFLAGLAFTGWGLAGELTGRALTHRGLDRTARTRLLRTQRARVLGFGIVAQLGMMVPLVSVVAMPTLVAGSTQLASDLVAGRPRAVAVPPAIPRSRAHAPRRNHPS